MSPGVRMVAAVVLAGLATTALAAQPCPPETVAAPWYDALGYGVLLLATVAGLIVPWLAWRGTRPLRRGVRALFVVLSCLVMLGIWAAGLLVWLGAFVLRC